jgi:hypothetical protein
MEAACGLGGICDFLLKGARCNLVKKKWSSGAFYFQQGNNLCPGDVNDCCQIHFS